MISYSCDMCGQSLVPEENERYVVKIEVYSACDSLDSDCEDEEFINDFEEDEGDCDDEMDNLAPDDIENIEYKTFRYDLCCKCHSRYLQDPLSIKSIRRGRFSEN